MSLRLAPTSTWFGLLCSHSTSVQYAGTKVLKLRPLRRLLQKVNLHSFQILILGRDKCLASRSFSFTIGDTILLITVCPIVKTWVVYVGPCRESKLGHQAIASHIENWAATTHFAAVCSVERKHRSVSCRHLLSPRAKLLEPRSKKIWIRSVEYALQNLEVTEVYSLLDYESTIFRIEERA